MSQQNPLKICPQEQGSRTKLTTQTQSTTSSRGRVTPEAVFEEFLPLLCLSLQLQLSLLELLLPQELPPQPLLLQGLLLLPQLLGLLCSLGSKVLLLQLLLVSCFLPLCWCYLPQKCVSHTFIILSVIRNKQGESCPEGKTSSMKLQQSYFKVLVSLLEVKTRLGTQTGSVGVFVEYTGKKEEIVGSGKPCFSCKS